LGLASQYKPTPVPAQTGRTNYVDNDRIGASLSVEYGVSPALVTDEVPDDAILAGEPVVGREGLQTNNPGSPGFSSAGFIGTGALYLTVLL
jgi:long-chain fatty acid transport protein